MNETELFEKARCGCEDSINLIVNDHMKYVEMMAKKYGNNKKYGVPYKDMFSICKTAMIKCIQNHDPSKGKFSSYIYNFMKRDATNAIRKQRQVYVTNYFRLKGVEITTHSSDAIIESDDNDMNKENRVDEYNMIKDVMYQEEFAVLYENLLPLLTEREMYVISKKFGLFGYTETNQKELAKELNVTAMTILHTYRRAIKKMNKKWKKL